MSHMDMDQHVVELQYAYAGQIRKDKITIIKHRLHLAGDTHIELGYKDTGAFFVYDCEGESFSLIAIGQEQPQNANYNARCTAIHAAGAAHKAAFGANGAVKNITILKKASLEQPSIQIFFCLALSVWLLAAPVQDHAGDQWSYTGGHFRAAISW